MKKLLFLMSIFGSQQLMSQFDRVLVDPISKFPSLAGNEGKTRLSIGTSGSTSEISNPVSLDFFSPKMKGAYGISMGYLTRFNNSNRPSLTYIGSMVYSPKLTFKKKQQTWAPAIGLKYAYKSRDTDSIIDNNGNKIEESYARSLILSPYLGMSVNTTKYLVAYSFVGNRYYSVLQNNFMGSYKFDRNNSNKISSTLSSELEINIKLKRGKSTSFSNTFTGNVKPIAAKVRISYDLDLSRFYLSQGIHFSTVKHEYINYPIEGENVIFNEKTYLSTRTGYKGKKFNSYIGFNYGNKNFTGIGRLRDSSMFFGATFSF